MFDFMFEFSICLRLRLNRLRLKLKRILSDLAIDLKLYFTCVF